jgi:hypothetical protein
MKSLLSWIVALTSMVLVSILIAVPVCFAFDLDGIQCIRDTLRIRRFII